MNRSTAVLGAALAVSVLLNIVAFTRARSGPTPSARAEARVAAERKPDAPDSLAAELERERGITRELRESIKRLEADREVLAQSATSAVPAAAPKPPAEGLREKLRRMKKLFKSAENGGQPDQEEVLAMTGEIMELMKLGLARSKDPKTYAEFMRICVEVALEDDAALNPAQADEYARVTGEMADALGRIAASTPGERLVRELEIEADAVARLQTILTSEQREVLKKGGMDDMTGMSASMSMTYLQKKTATDTIVKSWTTAYQLQEAQLPAARAAAESFLRELEKIKPPAAEMLNYESRIASLRAQMAALKTLEGALTSAQFDRLGSQPPREFQLMDFITAVEVPEKK